MNDMGPWVTEDSVRSYEVSLPQGTTVSMALDALRLVDKTARLADDCYLKLGYDMGIRLTLRAGHQADTVMKKLAQIDAHAKVSVAVMRFELKESDNGD